MQKPSGTVERTAAEIQKRRKAEGMTVEQLADSAGVNARHLYRIEAGEIESPGLDLLGKLATALGCDVTDLARERMTAVPTRAKRVSTGGALTLLDKGSQISLQLFDLRDGPLTFRVNQFDGGEVVLADNMRHMLMDELIKSEQRGENDDDLASWWYVITAQGRKALKVGGWPQ